MTGPVGAAPAAHARANIRRLTAAALAVHPNVAADRNRDSVATDGNAVAPRSALVASSASSVRSYRKSPPASWVSTNAR